MVDRLFLPPALVVRWEVGFTGAFSQGPKRTGGNEQPTLPGQDGDTPNPSSHRQTTPQAVHLLWLRKNTFLFVICFGKWTAHSCKFTCGYIRGIIYLVTIYV